MHARQRVFVEVEMEMGKVRPLLAAIPSVFTLLLYAPISYGNRRRSYATYHLRNLRDLHATPTFFTDYEILEGTKGWLTRPMGYPLHMSL